MRCVGKTRVTGGIDQHGKSGTRKSMEKKRDENVCLRERERERERERLKKRERESWMRLSQVVDKGTKNLVFSPEIQS